MARPDLDFHVRRDDYASTRFVEGSEPGDLAAGQVLFDVDRFAITANNVSYALSGDGLGYWRFFPSGEEGWGRVPAMGFANVVASRHPDVAEGTRCFGFYPMSRSLVIEPSQVSAANIVDGAAHREGLAPVYAQYSPVNADAIYTPDSEDAIMLMRGLFMTSFLVDDYIAGVNILTQPDAVFTVDDATDYRLGAEYIVFTKFSPLAIRGGIFTESDSTIRALSTGTNSLATPEAFAGKDDQLHGAVGLGLSRGRFQFDLGADFSESDNEYLISIIFQSKQAGRP